MKLGKLLLISLLPLALAGCKNKDDKERQTDEPVVVDPDQTVESIEEKDHKLIPSYVVNRLNEYTSYKSVTTGSTISSGVIKVTQTIDVTSIKSEYSYTKNESHSSIVNTVHEAYFHDSKSVYRDKDSGNFSTSSLDDYLSIYGSYAFSNSLEGYSVKEDAIVSVTKLNNDENGKYVFFVVFDNEKATDNVKIQMKKIGGLDDYPTFKLIEMTVVISNDFTLSNIFLHSKYNAKKVLKTECEQSYKVSFSNYNEEIDVPNLDLVKDLFNV